MMDYRIEKKPAFKVICKSREFPNHKVNDYDADPNNIPAFWVDCHKDGTIKKLRSMGSKAEFGYAILGICRSDYCKTDENFLYSIGTGYNGGEVPNGFDTFEVKENTWAVFKSKDTPEERTKTWKQIFTEFFPTSDYSPKNDVDFEVYANSEEDDGTLEYEIWIPVEKK